MAITAALVTALGGGKIDYVPITPNAGNFTVTLPAGTWLVQVEATNTSGSNTSNVTLAGVTTEIPTDSPHLVTRIVQGGTLTGTVTGGSATFTHGVALKLGN